jgi:hypothetical protein
MNLDPVDPLWALIGVVSVGLSELQKSARRLLDIPISSARAACPELPSQLLKTR